ncbi:hypothetical protein KAT51_00995 [bacterium]|nr:hypothetical protein [bacterium]
MGRALDKFKNKQKNVEKLAKNASKGIEKLGNERHNNQIQDNRKNNKVESGFGDDDFGDEDFGQSEDGEEYPIQQTQKPESFFHFILENQYKDLERSIRGLKDVWDKKQGKFITKRKKSHCFTDEESEEILRAVQSHLATDIKLSNIRMDAFPVMMDAIYKQVSFLFYSIADYRYGRYGGMETQYDMKLQNQKIFLEVMTRIQANYSRAVGGKENIATHGSVKGQESLQSGDSDVSGKKWSY